MAFTWIPFYHELAGKVLEFEDKENELLEVLREIKDAGLPCIPLQDNQPDGTQKPLEVIDPFTFLAILARVETESAREICAWLKGKWKLDSLVPADFNGRAPVQARGGGSWFFGSIESGRQPQDVKNLWKLAQQAYQYDFTDVDFDLIQACLNHDNLGFRKLTNGLSWVNPKGFLPTGGPILDFLRKRGIRFSTMAVDRRQAQEYLTIMRQVQNINTTYVDLVIQAVKHNKGLPHLSYTLDTEESSNVTEPNTIMITTVPCLNKILYGPPGTGKTFSSISKAVEIIDGSAPEVRAKCQRRFHELRASGQIGFVTFHQSFSYEEFIEGLRPDLEVDSGEARYKIRDGILKEMALQAIGITLDDFDYDPITFEEIWEGWRKDIEKGNHIMLQGLSDRSYYKLALEDDAILGENTLSVKDHRYFRCYPRYAKPLWEKYEDKEEIRGPDVRDTFPEIVGEAAFYAVIINEMKALAALLRTSDEELGRQFLAGEMEASSDFDNAPKFVLIIDEINRGNISKIFGELITLLEDDKRIGEANELRVTLPTSGEEFALPPNLYILGTMNTADKSLAQLDVALRRRFEFEELAPRPELCDQLGGLPEVLTALNERVEWAIDREHRLGHAYFMDVDSEEKFNERFRSKVVPLLIEYFPHDFKTLRAVLGESADGFLREFKAPSGFNGPTKYRWWFEVGQEGDKTFSAFDRLKSNFGI